MASKISHPRRIASALILVLTAGSAQCAAYDDLPAPAKPPESSSLAYFKQGWSPALRELAYFTPQGSRLIPYRWFMALENPDNNGKFSAIANLTRYGWLNYGKTSLNPDGLPIGFAIDPAEQPGTGRWLGLNCTACHTGEVSRKGQSYRVDGGPARADFGAFLVDLAEALKATRLDGEPLLQGKPPGPRFQRFAAEVIGHPPSPRELAALLGAVEQFAVKFEGEIFMRTPALPAGRARVDALGQITNALMVFDLHEPDNLRPSSAPVSYPFLWLAPKLDFVQWTPVASNPISRNVGQVMGVFGQADFTDKTNQFASSVLLKELALFEDWFDQLDPPVWPAETFGSLNAELAKQGKQLFDRDCRGCHNMPPYRLSAKEDNQFGRQFIQITRTPFKAVGTDPTYTLNLITRTAKSGALNGPLFGDKRPIVPGAEIFFGSVFHVLKEAFKQNPLSPEEFAHYNGYRFCSAKISVYCPAEGREGQQWQAPPDAAVSIKAGPLFGIWATGPFLHNGSVPNIYELLSPPHERSRVFWVGGTELNLEKLGFQSTEPELPPEVRAKLFRFDTGLPGNSNTGHAYPAAGYSPADRMAVIEYLKDPGDWH